MKHLHLGIVLLALFSLSPVANAYIVVPTAFTNGVVEADEDSDLSPAGLVSMYTSNRVVLVATRAEEHKYLLKDVEISDRVRQAVTNAAGASPTGKSLEDALANLIQSDPDEAVAYTAAAIALAQSNGFSTSAIYSLLAKALVALSRFAEPDMESIAKIIGFGVEVGKESSRGAVVSRLRIAALSTIFNDQDGDKLTSHNTIMSEEGAVVATALDSALVNARVLEAYSVGDRFGSFVNSVPDITMDSQLLSTLAEREMTVFQTASDGVTGGTGLGTDPFATSGATDTPGNPGGVLNPFPTSPTPTPTPSIPTPTPAPTPPPPVS